MLPLGYGLGWAMRKIAITLVGAALLLASCGQPDTSGIGDDPADGRLGTIGLPTLFL
jgi:hypothetical protein